MLRLRVLQPATRSLRRHNATVAASVAGDASATPPPPTAATSEEASTPDVSASQPAHASPAEDARDAARAATAAASKAQKEAAAERTRQRVKRFPPKRPQVSLEHPREWNRPVAPGVLPAYDEALKLLKQDSQALKKELEAVNARIAEAKEDEAEELKKKAHILEVQSEINLPDVRWKFRNRMADMTKPVYRHLAEQKWRTEGGLDLVMERIHQMGVVPDVLPELHPSIDVRLTFPEAPPESTYLRTRVKRKQVPIEAGVMLLPEQTRKPPTLYTTVFHPETRYYTMMLIDPDVPDEATQSFQTYLHWMQPNIPLNALSTTIPLPALQHTRYIPPHPQKGTPYHRYTLLILPHADPTTTIDVPQISDEQRAGFEVRKFAEHYGLDGAKGGGVFMWREVWDAEVSKIYQDVLKQDEPRFGHARKPDAYADLKALGKYPGQRFRNASRHGSPLSSAEEAAEKEAAQLYAAADAVESGVEAHASRA